MKKISLLTLIIFFASISYGQWSVGARAGFDFSKLTGGWDDQGSRGDSGSGGMVFGPVAGVVGNYEFTDMISVNAELLYVMLGEKYESYDEGWKTTQDEYTAITTGRYSYLQLPILVRAIFGTSWLFFANLGPYFGYKIGGTLTTEYPNGEESKQKIRFKERKDPSDYLYESDLYRRFDFGMYLGGGAAKKLGPGVLEADLRLGIGFLDHNKDMEKSDYYKPQRTLIIAFTLAYMYPFGKEAPKRFTD